MRAASRLSLPILPCVAAVLLVAAPGASGSGRQLVFSTYLGGAFKYGDIGNDVAVDREGNVYVTGRSYYSDFPVTPGAFQTKSHSIGPWDTAGFVAKFDPTGSRLIYATYLGGEGGETTGEGIAVDAAGDAYVSGYTSSKNFPTTPGALRESGSGGFVAKLDPTGSALVYSTLIGGATTHVSSIGVDAAGNAYVAANAVMKLDPTGTGLAYSYLLDPWFAADIAVDPAGDAYIAGADKGAFATKLDPSGGFVYSTPVGGVGGSTDAIAIDSQGHAYVAGRRRGHGAFVVKLEPDGSKPAYSILLPSSSLDAACRCGVAAIAVDGAGDAFLVGSTRAPRLPTSTGALQRRPWSRPKGSTPYVAELGPDGDLGYATYLGGEGDFAAAVALGPAGHVYVTGGTISGALPVSPGAFQRKPRESDGYAAFVTALDPTGAPVAGLAIRAIERRGNRIRLRGALDPAARGTLAASVSQGHTRRPIRLRRRKGALVASIAAPGTGSSLKVALRFAGSDGWQDASVCRKAEIGAALPGRWTLLRIRGCAA